MSLRTQIFVYVVAVMAIVFTLVAATLLPDRLLAQKFNLALGREAAEALQSMLEQLSGPQRDSLLRDNSQMFLKENILEGWIVSDESGKVRIWRFPQAARDQISDDFITKTSFDYIGHFNARDGEALVLYARTNSQLLGPSVDLWRIFAVMAVGTMLMLVVLYSLLLRLIVKPVERLAAASTSPALARGIVLQVPHTDRNDEIGELVRAYNKMASEMNDLRQNLEKRVQDATRNLEAAQQQIVASERLSAAGRIAAGVAHEVNNPLGGMINAARTLRARAAPGKDSEYLDLIVEGLARVQTIVASMLQFSRPVQQSTSVDLREVLDGALMFCRYRVQNMQVTVAKNFETNGAAPCTVIANRTELGQVFLNLMVNALDAMEAKGAGPHTLTLEVKSEDGSVLVTIGDTGIGMKPEVQERAGQFFYTTKSEGKGTGLGLSVVQHIVLRHNGGVGIQSTEGVGTKVVIKLPVEAKT